MTSRHFAFHVLWLYFYIQEGFVHLVPLYSIHIFNRCKLQTTKNHEQPFLTSPPLQQTVSDSSTVTSTCCVWVLNFKQWQGCNQSGCHKSSTRKTGICCKASSQSGLFHSSMRKELMTVNTSRLLQVFIPTSNDWMTEEHGNLILYQHFVEAASIKPRKD